MLINYLILIIIAFGGGIVTGGAVGAFITLLQIIPKLTVSTETYNKVKVYQNMFSLGAIVFIFIYFSDFHINLGKISTMILGLIMGVFIGVLSSALAEVLNVMPVISKKIKIKEKIKVIIYAILAGKVLGSLYFFLIH